MSEDDDLKTLHYILQNHEDKDFVKRIRYPHAYPSLPLGKDKSGNDATGTHLMMWGDYDGIPVVFPSIVHQEGKLTKLNPDEAFNHAVKTGEYIPFTSPDEADWFSKNYKKTWNIK